MILKTIKCRQTMQINHIGGSLLPGDSAHQWHIKILQCSQQMKKKMPTSFSI